MLPSLNSPTRFRLPAPRVIAIAGSALVATGLVTARFVGGYLIRQIYAGRGPAVLGRLMGGRSTQPVESYLGSWNHVVGLVAVASAAPGEAW